MAIAEREIQQFKVLTYEDYLMEGETPGRYEIIDGVREWMTSPHDYHQDIAQNFYDVFRQFQKHMGLARAYLAPVDIVTQFASLKVRQPDVMLISKQRYGNRQPFDKAPWPTAPELAVEVLSPTEAKSKIAKKLTEYASVSILECWLAYPETRQIEVWILKTDAAPSMAAIYSSGQSFSSTAFPALSIDVASIFES